MHELSVAMSVVQIATEETRKNGADSVETIVLEIGELSGIEMDAFLFAWDEAVNGSVLEKAERKIERPKGLLECTNCQKTYPALEKFEACPDCQIPGLVIQGDEMKVKSLILVQY